ncbi:MAG: acyltransferase family protein [Devosiaceae bacterium]|nr:acyltransferase family protein [Devosiaceae bacterium]
MSQSKRMDWVDSAKGISIILVVMLYVANSVGKATGEVGILHYVIGFATPFRMPEFFLISGLFLSLVIARDWKSYLDRRFVHYLYFYALWALIIIAAKYLIFTPHLAHALSLIVWSIIEPYSLLWFIYVLAFFSLTAKIAHSLKIPHWAMLAGAAMLQILPVDTPVYAFNQFSEYLIYFYSGYVFAPKIFNVVKYFSTRPLLIVSTLAIWAGINGALVFLPEFSAQPTEFTMGFAAIPGLHLALALIGAMMVCIAASLLQRFRVMGWLHYIGEHSIVIFLSFSIPMAISREILLRTGVITDTGIVSLIVMVVAIASPLVLYWLVQKTGWGKFLFTRPAWAHIPGTPGSLPAKVDASKVPAE